MRDKHSSVVGERVPPGSVGRVFPVEDLPCDVYQHRDAERVLESTPSDTVLGVAKTSLASAYLLHSHPLTVVDTVSLPDAVHDDVLERTGVDVHDYELLCIGDTSRTYENRTLAEYTD